MGGAERYIDAQLPRGGVMALRLVASAGFNMFAVDDDGVLRYYQYEGHGEPNPAPGNCNWADVSGVPIGHGWEDVTWILPYFGSTEIVILAVRDNGVAINPTVQVAIEDASGLVATTATRRSPVLAGHRAR